MGSGIDLPVGEGLAGEGDGFCDALGFAAHGWREVDAGGVFYEDVERAGPVVVMARVDCLSRRSRVPASFPSR